ncbi:MAG: chlorophyll synthesis pathway protein BchC [Pseudomonadota bacterium]
METLAIVLERPRAIGTRKVSLTPPADDDVVVEVTHSAISSGTERMLWDGSMPPFPGLSYPLVPGYETVGRIADGPRAGEPVFVPGARCFTDVSALFGGSAAHLVVPTDRAIPVASARAEFTLLSLAATAHHAIARGGLPDRIVGHGVLGRLIARIAVALGGAPVVHEIRASRRQGATGYTVLAPGDDDAQVGHIIDASGADDIIDAAVPRLQKGGKLTLAGFYSARMSFAFPAAFMKEISLILAAEWAPPDLAAVRELIDAGRLSLDGLVTHQATPADAADAYTTAFTDPDCLKLVLNWRPS